MLPSVCDIENMANDCYSKKTKQGIRRALVSCKDKPHLGVTVDLLYKY